MVMAGDQDNQLTILHYQLIQERKNMHFNRFQQGDKVTYIGEKLKQDLGGALGVVCAPVQNVPGGLVVDFGGDSIVVHESKLVPFQGHLKSDGDDKKKKEPKVEKRRRNRRGESEED